MKNWLKRTGNHMTEDGRTPDDFVAECGICSGSGTLHCSICEGSGTFEGDTCMECNQGRVGCQNCDGTGNVDTQFPNL